MNDEDFVSFHQSLEVITNGAASNDIIQEANTYISTLMHDYPEHFLVFFIKLIDNQNEPINLKNLGCILLKNFITSAISSNLIQFKEFWKGIESNNIRSTIKQLLINCIINNYELFEISSLTLAKIVKIEGENLELIRGMLDNQPLYALPFIIELLRSGYFTNTPELVEILTNVYQNIANVLKTDSNFDLLNQLIRIYIDKSIDFVAQIIWRAPYLFKATTYLQEYTQLIFSRFQFFDESIITKFFGLISLMSDKFYDQSEEYISTVIQIILSCPQDFLVHVLELIQEIIKNEHEILRRFNPSYFRSDINCSPPSLYISGKDKEDFVNHEICQKIIDAGILANTMQLLDSTNLVDYFESDIGWQIRSLLTNFMKCVPNCTTLFLNDAHDKFMQNDYIGAMKIINSVLDSYNTMITQDFITSHMNNIFGDEEISDFHVLILRFDVIRKSIKKYIKDYSELHQNTIPFIHDFISNFEQPNDSQVFYSCLRLLKTIPRTLKIDQKKELYLFMKDILLHTRENSSYQVLSLIDKFFIKITTNEFPHELLLELFDYMIKHLENINQEIDFPIDRIESTTNVITHYFTLYIDPSVDINIRLPNFMNIAAKFLTNLDVNLYETFLRSFKRLIRIYKYSILSQVGFILNMIKNAISSENPRLIGIAVETLGYLAWFNYSKFNEYLIENSDLMAPFSDPEAEISFEIQKHYITGIGHILCMIQFKDVAEPYFYNYTRICSQVIDTDFEISDSDERDMYISKYCAILSTLTMIIKSQEKTRTLMYDRESLLWMKKNVMNLVRKRFIEQEIYNIDIFECFCEFVATLYDYNRTQTADLYQSRLFNRFYDLMLIKCADQEVLIKALGIRSVIKPQ